MTPSSFPSKTPVLFSALFLFLLFVGLSGLGLFVAQSSEKTKELTQWFVPSLMKSWKEVAISSGELKLQDAQRWAKNIRVKKTSFAVQQTILLVEEKAGMFAFLKKKKYWVHHLSDKQGKELNSELAEDKKIFDLSNQSKEAKGDVPVVQWDSSNTRLTATLPLWNQKQFLGTMILGLSLFPSSSKPLSGWPFFFSAMVAWMLALFFLVFFRIPRWFHGVGFLLVCAVCLFSYVFSVERAVEKRQESNFEKHAWIQSLLRETPSLRLDDWKQKLGLVDKRWKIAETKPHLTLVPWKKEPMQRADLDGKGYLFFLIGLLGALLYFVFAKGWLESLGKTFFAFRHAYFYVIPAMLGMILLVFVPFFVGVSLSFFRHLGGNQYVWVGLQNFQNIFFDPLNTFPKALNFYYTLFVTVCWTVSNVFLHVSIGLFLALLLKNPLLKMKSIYRVLLILPWAIPNYITALIWKGMFHQQFGAINHLFALVGIQKVSWFSHTVTAFSANLMTNTWLGFPFMMVVSLGALQSIPGDLYEAANVDGANRWQQFKYITLPMLKPALFPSIILGSIWTFNMFNVIYLVSGGEPGGSTNILITEAYSWAFQRGDRYGYAAAYSTILFVLLLGYTFITNSKTKATEGI